MNICVIGIGYVGLVTGAGLADLGNRVICVDVDSKKIDGINKGRVPIFEEGLEELVAKNVQAGRLSFSADIARGVRQSQALIIAVGTPPKDGGEVDLSQLISLTEDLALWLDGYKIIAVKSTAPVGTAELMTDILEKGGNKRHLDFDIAFIPEFLREGTAVYDFFHPTRIVIGTDSERVGELLSELFQPLRAPIIVTTPPTAQMIKYAANAFLASRISFINEIANICEKVGTDVAKIIEGISSDPRLGQGYLNPGLGFGGPCLAKDLTALIKTAEAHGYDAHYLKSILKKNEHQVRTVLAKIREAAGGTLGEKTVGILGLAFKGGTNDVRNSLSLKIMQLLKKEGAAVKAYDPQGMEEARRIIKNVILVSNPYEAARAADALVILTGWPEFKALDFKEIKKTMKTPVIIDGINFLEPSRMRKLGFIYQGVGR